MVEFLPSFVSMTIHCNKAAVTSNYSNRVATALPFRSQGQEMLYINAGPTWMKTIESSQLKNKKLKIHSLIHEP